MSVVWYGLWFLVAVGLLVTVHEFGHYWVARRLGFKVLRFSIGFGQPLITRVAGPDRTEYVVAAIPLGGYVKLLDEREAPVPEADLPRSFTRRPPWQRILVLLAGPAFNIVFAVLVLAGMLWANGINELKPVIGDVVQGSVAARAGLRSGDVIRALDGAPVSGRRDVVFGLLDAMSARGAVVLHVRGEDGGARDALLDVPNDEQRRRLTEPGQLLEGLGFQFSTPRLPAVLGEVKANGAAARAGLKSGDEVLAVAGEPVKDFDDLKERISARPGQTLEIAYRRAGAEAIARVTVAAEQIGGHPVGRIRVSPAMPPDSILTHTSLNAPQALAHACGEAWSMTVMQARYFWRMLLGRVSLKNLSGPISIAEYAGDSAEAGIASFLSFLTLISLSLGFLNLLPIPILDGGQIVFQVIEWLKGSPLSDRAQAVGQQVGIALLILLMGVALFNDVMRQFS